MTIPIDWTKLEANLAASAVAAVESFAETELGPKLGADAKQTAIDLMAIVKAPDASTRAALAIPLLKDLYADYADLPTVEAAPAPAPVVEGAQ